MQLLKFIAVAPLVGSALAMPAPGISPREASPLESRGIKSCGKMTAKLGECAMKQVKDTVKDTAGEVWDKINPLDRRGVRSGTTAIIHCLAAQYNSLEALKTEGETEINVDNDQELEELHKVDDSDVDEVDEELAQDEVPTNSDEELAQDKTPTNLNKVKKFRLARKYFCACGESAYTAFLGPAATPAAALEALLPGPGDLICKAWDKFESPATPASPANPEE